MTRNVILLADFFFPDVRGGAELYTAQLLKSIETINTFKTSEITEKHIGDFKQENVFLLISNFKLLSEANKKLIMGGLDYAIIDHDPQWCKSNNPALYKNFVLPEEQIQHKEFYKNAKAVFVQSKMHADIITKNLLLNNVVNLGCNLWDEEILSLLEQKIGKVKNRKYAVMESKNKNKGFPEATTYCNLNKISYEIIPPLSPEKFLNELSKTENLVFFPQWFETYCRVAIEARILGCKLITNKMLGCASEEYFKLKGKDLLNFIKNEQKNVIDKIKNVINGLQVEFFTSAINPKVSLISTFYKGKEFLSGFLESFEQQTYENKELILIDANSPEHEYLDIDAFIAEHKHLDIKYVRKTEQITPAQAFNEATELATGDYIAICLIDDRLANEHLETLSKHLTLNEDVDLVYADCLQTTKPNETVLKNSSRGRLYEHSRMEFSPENMIKCLPGPMPMYRKSVHKKCGNWNNELKHACDWELWMRMVRSGSKFLKINKVLGLYYFNTQGLSTSSDPDKMIRRRTEERDVFNEYRDVLGEKNYNLYKDYFNNI